MSTETAKGTTDVSEPTKAQQQAGRRAAEAKATVPDATYSRPFTPPAAGGESDPIDVIVAALARTLREMPSANAAHRDARLEQYSRVNVAIGVPGPCGYDIPVTIFDADAKDPEAICAERRSLAARADSGELTAPETAGATCSVIDLSGSGLRTFTPILTPPHALALGVAEELSVTCDHRVIGPRTAAELLARIAAAVQ